MSAPLAGTTVLDFSTVGPAARCARILADYGAAVVKIGPPPRAGAVGIRPPWWAYAAERGMQRVRIDLKATDGRALFLRLAEGADVVLESFRPGVVARLGIGYEDVRRRNPRIVYCSASGYGQDGPHAGWAGHDLDYLAVGGFLACSGRRADGAPALPGATIADGAAGGMHAAVAILAALLERGASGAGCHLDVSVADGVVSLMALAIEEHLATGVEPGPGHDLLTGRYACYDVYRARDGKWLAVAAIEPSFFANLCRLLGLERFAAQQTDDAWQEEIRAAFREAFARRDRDTWVAELAPADTCVAPVYAISELVMDPQFRHRGAFVVAEHASRGELRQVGAVLAGADRSPPRLLRDVAETDTDAWLRKLGLPEGEIERLREEGVVA